MPKQRPAALARMAESLTGSRAAERKPRGRPRGSGNGPTLGFVRAIVVAQAYEAAMLADRGEEAALVAAAAAAGQVGRPVGIATVQRILARYYSARPGATVLTARRQPVPMLEPAPGETYKGAPIWRPVMRDGIAFGLGERPALPRKPRGAFTFGARRPKR